MAGQVVRGWLDSTMPERMVELAAAFGRVNRRQRPPVLPPAEQLLHGWNDELRCSAPRRFCADTWRDCAHLAAR